MAQAINDTQLATLILPKIRIAVDYVVQRIWDENRSIIRQVVYNSYVPEKYQRTGQFKEAWDTTSRYTLYDQKAVGEFYYDPSKLKPGNNDPDSPYYGQHVSAIDMFLMTEYLAEVIYQGKSGPAFGSGTTDGEWHNKRDAWEKLNEVIGRQKLKQWMKEGFELAGLPVHSHGGSWRKTEW